MFSSCICSTILLKRSIDSWSRFLVWSSSSFSLYSASDAKNRIYFFFSNKSGHWSRCLTCPPISVKTNLVRPKSPFFTWTLCSVVFEVGYRVLKIWRFLGTKMKKNYLRTSILVGMYWSSQTSSNRVLIKYFKLSTNWYWPRRSSFSLLTPDHTVLTSFLWFIIVSPFTWVCIFVQF